MKSHHPDSVANRLIVLMSSHPGTFYASHEAAQALFQEDFAASSNAVATRLNELEREGYCVSNFRDGKNFKQWGIPGKPKQLEMI